MRKPRILIYDDDPVILDLLKHLLLKRGYEVFAYREPKVCPLYETPGEQCAHHSPCADMMISDFEMPKMSGIELYQRQAQRGCAVDIRMKAILSGYTDPSLAEQCKSLRCAFLQKPFQFSELTEWLTACEERLDLSQPLNNRRESNRLGFQQDIVYTINFAPHITYPGTTLDKSTAGLGLHTVSPLRSGDTIKIVKGLENTQLTGEVRWCRKQGDESYRAGLLLV